MIVLDANILLYAYNADAPQHRAAAAWLEELYSGSETIGLPWVTLWAFLRIATNPRLWPEPKSPEAAFEAVKELMSRPGVVIVNPGARHAEILKNLVGNHKAAGPLLTDAALAAMALEHGATLASSDQDFSRFKSIRWVNPIA